MISTSASPTAMWQKEKLIPVGVAPGSQRQAHGRERSRLKAMPAARAPRSCTVLALPAQHITHLCWSPISYIPHSVRVHVF